MTRPDRPIRTCRQQAFGQFWYLTVPSHSTSERERTLADALIVLAQAELDKGKVPHPKGRSALLGVV